MSSKADREGLSLWYRVTYRVRYVVMHVFGPAQLGDDDNPHVRLQRQRQAKVEAARRARLTHEAERDS